MLIDQAGTMIWEKLYKEDSVGTYHGWANVADRTADGGYVIGGSRDTIGTRAYTNLVRYDVNADTLWTRVWGNGIEDWGGQQVKQTQDGGFIIAGTKGAGTQLDGFLIKTDSLGNQEWLQTYGGGGTDFFAAVDILPNSGYYVGGEWSVTPANYDFWVYRLNSIGQVIWESKWGSQFDEPNAHLMTASDGHCVVAAAWGYWDDFIATRPYMAKLDSANGSVIWEKEYGPTGGSTGFFTVKECSNTDYIAAGVTYSNNMGQRGLLLRTNSNGDSLWMRDYHYADAATGITQGRARLWDVIQTPDGGFIGCGWVLGDTTAPGYSQDTWVLKVDSMGCIVPGCDSIGIGITEVITNLTDAIIVYPNPTPSNAPFTVEIDLPESIRNEALRITMVNSLGQVIHEGPIPNSEAPAILSSPTEAGMYYLHLSAGSRWISGIKLMIE